MGDSAEYWFSEGTYAFKAGIPLSKLEWHYPEDDMSPGEWRALESGWINQQVKTLEESGQKRLF